MKNKAIPVLLILFISIMIQHALYSFLDWQAGKLLNPSINFDKKYFIETTGTEPSDLQLSYNNNYLGLIQEKKLKVLNLFRNEQVFDSGLYFDSGAEILGYRWLPDRNSLLFFITEPGHPGVLLYSLDLNDYHGKEVHPKLDRRLNFPIAEIKNIEISTYTNNLYLLFTDDNQRSRLIKIDIMKGINWLDFPQENIHNIAVSNKYGYLFIESSYNKTKRLMIFDGQKRGSMPLNPNVRLFASKDNLVYLGKTANGYLEELFILDYEKENGRPARVWQGKLAYEMGISSVSDDNELMLRTGNKLYIFSPQGLAKKVELPASEVVLTSTGSIYLEVIPAVDGLYYYWRKVDDSLSRNTE